LWLGRTAHPNAEEWIANQVTKHAGGGWEQAPRYLIDDLGTGLSVQSLSARLRSIGIRGSPTAPRSLAKWYAERLFGSISDRDRLDKCCVRRATPQSQFGSPCFFCPYMQYTMRYVVIYREQGCTGTRRFRAWIYSLPSAIWVRLHQPVVGFDLRQGTGASGDRRDGLGREGIFDTGGTGIIQRRSKDLAGHACLGHGLRGDRTECTAIVRSPSFRAM